MTAADLTFNQLLGINNSGEIAGYFGSGAADHPNKGYTILSPYAQTNYTNENFPGSVQTQVTGLNNLGDTCGFWVDGKGNNFGFIEWNGVFTSYTDPRTGKGTTNQILGINDRGFAVGFYVGVKGDSHAFRLNQARGKFEAIDPPGGKNAVATGINARGDITGFLTAANGAIEGFLLKGKTFTEFAFPGSANTTPFGVNAQDEIVGAAHVDASGGTHGFGALEPTHARRVPERRRPQRRRDDAHQRAERRGRPRRLLHRRGRQYGRLPRPAVSRIRATTGCFSNKKGTRGAPVHEASVRSMSAWRSAQ